MSDMLPGFYWFYMSELPGRPKSVPRWVVVEVLRRGREYLVRLPGGRHLHSIEYMERYVGSFGPYLAPPTISEPGEKT